MTKISAVIITFNEEENIERCLSSLQGIVDEIVVMDSFSTDATEKICNQLHAKFYQQPWKGYGPQKNDAIQKTSHDFILSIDADEELSKELQTSILKLKETEMKGVYEMRRLSMFCGRLIKYGSWNPEKKIRIFRKDEATWNNREVHEGLEISPDIQKSLLKGPLLHYTSNSIQHRVETINKYSSLGAHVYLKAGKKSNLLKIVAKPWLNFLTGFFVKRGFMDGSYGLILAVLLAYETFLKYAKLYELQKK